MARIVGKSKVRLEGPMLDGSGVRDLARRGEGLVKEHNKRIADDARAIVRREAFATGELYRSIEDRYKEWHKAGGPSGVPSKIIGTVGATARHARFVERGRKPGRGPSLKKLREWAAVVRPDLTTKKELQSYARHVLWHIKRKGIAPVAMFAKAGERDRGPFYRDVGTMMQGFAGDQR